MIVKTQQSDVRCLSELRVVQTQFMVFVFSPLNFFPTKERRISTWEIIFSQITKRTVSVLLILIDVCPLHAVLKAGYHGP